MDINYKHCGSFWKSDDSLLKDCLKRAKSLSGKDWHSGTLCDNKDARRVVCLMTFVSKLQAENKQLKDDIHSMDTVNSRE